MKHVLTTLALLCALPAADAWANPQHDRMRECNQQAKEQTLRGDERKAFMKVCLSGKHDTTAPTAKIQAKDQTMADAVDAQEEK